MPIQINIKIRETKEGVRYQVRSPNAPNATKAEIGVASALLKRFDALIEELLNAADKPDNPERQHG